MQLRHTIYVAILGSTVGLWLYAHGELLSYLFFTTQHDFPGFDSSHFTPAQYRGFLAVLVIAVNIGVAAAAVTTISAPTFRPPSLTGVVGIVLATLFFVGASLAYVVPRYQTDVAELSTFAVAKLFPKPKAKVAAKPPEPKTVVDQFLSLFQETKPAPGPTDTWPPRNEP